VDLYRIKPIHSVSIAYPSHLSFSLLISIVLFFNPTSDISNRMPSQSKVRQYQDHKVDFSHLSDKSYEVFRKWPFRWQLEAAQAILCGWDIDLDIGTGSGKTLCFTLLLLLNNSNIALTVSPLTALIIDQAC